MSAKRKPGNRTGRKPGGRIGQAPPFEDDLACFRPKDKQDWMDQFMQNESLPERLRSPYPLLLPLDPECKKRGRPSQEVHAVETWCRANQKILRDLRSGKVKLTETVTKVTRELFPGAASGKEWKSKRRTVRSVVERRLSDQR